MSPQLRLRLRTDEDLEDGVGTNVEFLGEERVGDCPRDEIGDDMRCRNLAGKAEEMASPHDIPPGASP